MIMRKLIPEIITYIALAFICAFVFGKNRSVEKPLQNVEVNSTLTGEWNCASINSCNDMSIKLSISQRESRLYFTREMTSKSGIGSSFLEGDADVTNEYSAYAPYASASYFIAGENLVEYFGKNNRWNIYSKDGSSKRIPGCYRDYLEKLECVEQKGTKE